MAEDLQESPQLLGHVQVKFGFPNFQHRVTPISNLLGSGVRGSGTGATGGTPGSAGAGGTAP